MEMSFLSRSKYPSVLSFTGLVTYTREPLPVVLVSPPVATKYAEDIGMESGAWKSSSRYSTMELPTGHHSSRVLRWSA